MKIRNLAACFVATLLLTQGALAQDEDVEPQEDPFRERTRHVDEYEDESEDGESEDEEEGASADRSFGNSGEFVISAERLLGIARTARTTQRDGVPDYKSTVDRAHLLVNASGDPVGYSAPRIAFDYFVSDGISLGASLGYSLDSSAFDDSLFLGAPRIGYALMFGEVVGIWPRLGVTFQEQKSSGNRVTLLAASGELPLVLVPTEHVVISLGPTLDLSIVGKINPQGPDKKTDFSAHEIGFSGAISIFF